MSHPKINFKVDVVGSNDSQSKGKYRSRPLTLGQILDIINQLSIDETIKKELVNKVKKYPMGTYDKFKSDIPSYIETITVRKKKEEYEKSNLEYFDGITEEQSSSASDNGEEQPE